ncbi:MAG: ABC transporter substrate-binding protein, partial [bacterium]|nr:ABC transporter substrate-binding protein [bacterium]
MGKHKIRWAAATAVAATAGIIAASVAAGAPPAAAATKSAFVIGFMNSTQGAVQFPGISDGAQAAVQYVNARGGINGHPLVLAVCDTDTTPEKNQACAQQFANDPRLKMVNVGFTLTPGPFYSALTPSGLPVIQSFPTTQADFNAPNAVAYNGGAPASTVGGAE